MIALHPKRAPQIELPGTRLITPVPGALELESPLAPSRYSPAMSRAVIGLALLDVSPSGVIGFATAKATLLLEKYYPAMLRSAPTKLPVPLLQWLQRNSCGESDPPATLIIQYGAEQLLLRITGREEGYFQLLLSERSDVVTVKQLAQLGLTPKEAEVLLWITRGKTDADIAMILGCSPRTVNKHTEQIRTKLNVETRTAAAAIAQDFINTYW